MIVGQTYAEKNHKQRDKKIGGLNRFSDDQILRIKITEGRGIFKNRKCLLQ